jgi:hypothetical protein
VITNPQPDKAPRGTQDRLTSLVTFDLHCVIFRPAFRIGIQSGLGVYAKESMFAERSNRSSFRSGL